MNAYELRMNCLEMAERQLHNQQEFTTDALFTHAKQLYDFVQNGNVDLESTPKTWIIPSDFIEKLSVQHPVNGPIPFKLYDFQMDIIKSINDNTNIMINESRQMGMTTTIAYYLIWLAQKQSKNILVVADSRHMTLEIKNRMNFAITESDIIDNVRMTFQQMKFNNGSTISFGTLKDIDPFRYDIVWIDNAAFISPNKTKDLDLELSKFEKAILSSTPYKTSGLFYDLWINDTPWTKKTIHWSMHPDRDIKWAKDTIALTGADVFAREHDNVFE